MAGVIKVDEIEKSSDTGTGIKLNSPLLNSTGTEIMSGAGSITIPSGQSIRNSSGTEIMSATGALSGVNFVGMIAAFALDTPPTGWLVCDGSELDADTYPVYADLHNIMKDVGGVGNYAWGGSSSSAFNIPDLRGEFLRGWDDGAGNDGTSGRTFASQQAAAIKKYNMHIFSDAHTGGAKVAGETNNEYNQGSGNSRMQIVHSGYPIGYGGYTSSNYIHLGVGHSDVGVGYGSLYATVGDPYGSLNFTPANATNSYNSALAEIGNGEETRPRNVAVQYCIKF